jgi:hemerythrin
MSITKGWTADLATGIKVIDDQHRELFHEVEQLLSAMRYGYSHHEVERTMKFLCKYMQEHFRAEETAMQRARYPGLETHRLSHGEFVERIQKLELDLAWTGPSKALAVKVQRVLCVTLNDDIVKHDKAMAEYLREQPGGIAGLFRGIRKLWHPRKTTRILLRRQSTNRKGD